MYIKKSKQKKYLNKNGIKKRTKNLMIEKKRSSYFKIKKQNIANKLISNKLLFIFFFLFIIILLNFFLAFFRIFKTTKFGNHLNENFMNKNDKILKDEAIKNELNKKPFSEQLNYFNNRMKDLRRSSIIWPLPSEIKLKPIMSPIELNEFCYFMKPENKYFEFGSGGSTNIAAYYNLNKIYSVESDVSWHNKIKNYNFSDIIFLTVDLKSKNDYGHPGPGTNVEDWKKYIQAYKPEYNADIILIDGRFRVACCLDIFSKIRQDTLVLIHDYSYRENYHIWENYYIKIKHGIHYLLFLKIQI